MRIREEIIYSCWRRTDRAELRRSLRRRKLPPEVHPRKWEKRPLRAGVPRGETDLSEEVSELLQLPTTDGRRGELEQMSEQAGQQTIRLPRRSDICTWMLCCPAVGGVVGLGIRSGGRSSCDGQHHHEETGKRSGKKQQKKIAQGHAQDDEEEQTWQQTMTVIFLPELVLGSNMKLKCIWRQVFWVVIFRSEQSATGMTIQSRRSIGIHPITKRNVVWSCVGR